MPAFIIYTKNITARIEYAMDIIFGVILNTDFELTSNRSLYQKSKSFKINYGNEAIDPNEVQLLSSGFLNRTGIEHIPIAVKKGEIPYFFAISNQGEIPFDLPAMVFYLVSRYEEYLPFSSDHHGRFSASQSIASQAGFLDRPIVDEWVIKLRTILLKKYPEAKLAFPSFKFQPTYDVDYAWAYKNKGWLFWGGLINDIRLGQKALLKQRIRVKWKGENDPYFFFDQYREMHLSWKSKPLFFFLLGDYSKYDKNIFWRHPEMQKLIKRTAEDFETGIHPSYWSNQKEAQLTKEINRLETTLHQPIKISRQHYLKLSFPSTYQRLLKAGIEHDFTMGYAEAAGFRAGIARAYPWYDLSKEKKTELVIHPFQVMDVTLKNYLKLSPGHAFALCENLLGTTKSVGGEFVTLWHNSSFSSAHGWTKDWVEGYLALMRKAE